MITAEQNATIRAKRTKPRRRIACSGVRLWAWTAEKPYFKRFLGIEKVHRNSIKITVDLWRRGRDSNPRGIAPKLISSQPRYDHFDTSPYAIYVIGAPEILWFRVSPVMTTSIPLRVCQTRSEHLEPQKRGKTKMLERRVRTAKYLVFRTRGNPWKQRETGGRKSLSCGGFRVSPVMTTSIPLRICVWPTYKLLYHTVAGNAIANCVFVLMKL